MMEDVVKCVRRRTLAEPECKAAPPKTFPRTVIDAGRKMSDTAPSPKISTPLREMPLPESDEEYAEYYRDRINEAHSEQLYPLMEDLADWINRTLDLEYLQGGNLMDMLDNGVLLCQLAKFIQDKAEVAVASSFTSPPVPTISARCFKMAARRSFFSRDNVEKFIQFCKKIGVHENLLFESDDLVLQNKSRNVVLCLMEVSRLAARFGIEPPGLVKLEREIVEEEEEEESQHDSVLPHDPLPSWQLHVPPTPAMQRQNCSSALPISHGHHYNSSRSKTPTSNEQNFEVNTCSNLRRSTSEGAHVDEPNKNAVNGISRMSHIRKVQAEDEWPRANSEHHFDYDCGGDKQSIDDLDKKVQRATLIVQRHCCCPNGKCEKLKIKKVDEGKYMIGGRNVFIRLLKGRHMMVRVGGGWDTLENFLVRHDPCQSNSKFVSRTSSPLPPKNNIRRHSNPHYHHSSPVDSLLSR